MQQDIQNHRDSDLISRSIRDKQFGLDKKKKVLILLQRMNRNSL